MEVASEVRKTVVTQRQCSRVVMQPSIPVGKTLLSTWQSGTEGIQ